VVLRVQKKHGVRPGVLIDNIETLGVKVVVQVLNEEPLPWNRSVPTWVSGWVYADQLPLNGTDSPGTHMVPVPHKPKMLLKEGKFFTRSKPQYENLSKDRFLNVLDFGAWNDGGSILAPENAIRINRALKAAASQNKVLLFPAGVYAVGHTLDIPVGSRITGALWSQIMAVGPSFSQADQPKVLAKYISRH
jgi:glucan 1,3-beta-glucosidase